MTGLYIIQIIIALLLIGAILMQSPAGGLGATFGGGGSFNTKRGMEKTLFGATIFLAIIFTLISLIALMV